MTQLSVPHFDHPPPAPAWLRPADLDPRDIVIVVLGAGHANRFSRLTREPQTHAQAYRVHRRQGRFSWRSAWLGALSALGLAGSLAAAAEATQTDRPIRIALPAPRPAPSLVPPPLSARTVGSNYQSRRSNPIPGAEEPASAPAGAVIPAAKLAPSPPHAQARTDADSSGEFYRAEPVQAAAQRAILSGVAQSWSYGGLTGVVIAGPLDLRSNRACRRIALWAESQAQPGDSMAFTSCLNDRSEWKTPADMRSELPSEFAGIVRLP